MSRLSYKMKFKRCMCFIIFAFAFTLFLSTNAHAGENIVTGNFIDDNVYEVTFDEISADCDSRPVEQEECNNKDVNELSNIVEIDQDHIKPKQGVSKDTTTKNSCDETVKNNDVKQNQKFNGAKGAQECQKLSSDHKTEEITNIKLAKNGWKTENSKTYYYEENVKHTGWLVTNDYKNYGTQKYWCDKKTGELAFGKLISRADAGFDAYSTSKGYVARGKFKEVNGRIYLADNNGKLENSGWLVTAKYDGCLQRYYIDADTRSLKTNFFRISNKLYHGDTNNGYVIRWKTRYGDGILLADNDGVIYEREGWLVTSKYDGHLERYRIDKTCAGWMGAHLGEFKVNNSRYYGLDGVGYVFRNDYDYFNSHWYVSNNDGVLTNADARFAIIEKYVKWMLSIAANNSHGYDQTWRWGQRGDYDCSSLTISALRVAGIDTRWATYTGNMRSALTCSGFYCRGLDNLKRGDILLNDKNHVAVYIGNGMIVQASGNEWGGATGGVPGDQNGREIWTCSYYDYPWNVVLRYRC